jgi:hypothetical protein
MLEQINGLGKASVHELQRQFRELFPNEKVPSTNKVWLFKKIAFRLQELEYGGLSAKAQAIIIELIQKYDPVNNKALRPDLETAARAHITPSYRDKRLPIPGSVITRKYKGGKVEVKVLEKGFEYNGRIYKSLTAISKEVTGSNWNAFQFFKL